MRPSQEAEYFIEMASDLVVVVFQERTDIMRACLQSRV